MRGRIHRLSGRVLVPLAGFLLVLGIPATGPAQAPRVGALKQKSAALNAESRRAVVDLYALDSALTRARADLARIDAQAASLARRQAAAQLRYRAAQETLTAAQQRLGRQLRALYERDDPDPIAVVLGASSLADALDELENISRTARATESVVAQSRAARALVARVRVELAARVARTRAAQARLVATTRDLERAHSERSAYLDRLRAEQALTASQIASLEERAGQAQRKAVEITNQASASAADAAQAPPAATTAPAGPDASAAPAEPPPAPVESVSGATSAPPAEAPGPPRPGGTMTVYATGYCLPGTTATGLPVGPGIVAVDPSVIPLGTRMTIPGYGEGVAADTGGAIRGPRIDVWIASCSEAAAFGRTVTITFR